MSHIHIYTLCIFSEKLVCVCLIDFHEWSLPIILVKRQADKRQANSHRSRREKAAFVLLFIPLIDPFHVSVPSSLLQYRA